MCLRKIDDQKETNRPVKKLVGKKGYIRAYKAVMDEEACYCGWYYPFTFREGLNKDGVSRDIFSNKFFSYPAGFHCCTIKRVAKTFIGDNDKLITVFILPKWVTSTGTQGGKALVCSRIFMPKHPKATPDLAAFKKQCMR